MKKEDEKMFISRLYDQNYDDLRKYLLKKSYAKGLEDDIIQETFLEACKKLNVLRKHPCPRGWLFKTAFMKSKELKKFYEKQNLYLFNTEVECTAINILLENIDFKESIRNLLSDEEYCMLMLRYVLFYSYKEIGVIYHISADACKKRIYRLCLKIGHAWANAQKRKN